MKIITIPDVHGRASWKLIVYSQHPDADEYVFVGDYFDTHESITGLEQLRNYEDIILFKKGCKKKVTLLIGNHDQIYWPGYSGVNVSGYQPGMATSFSHVLNENRELIQMAYSYENLLFTHAGVSETWMRNCIDEGGAELEYPQNTAEEVAKFVNNIWDFKPNLFSFCGIRDPYGNDITQTPIWIRPNSLRRASQNLKNKGIIQIVGHTQQRVIDIEGKSTGGKYFFIDCLGTSGEYLIYEDGIFKTDRV